MFLKRYMLINICFTIMKTVRQHVKIVFQKTRDSAQQCHRRLVSTRILSPTAHDVMIRQLLPSASYDVMFLRLLHSASYDVMIRQLLPSASYDVMFLQPLPSLHICRLVSTLALPNIELYCHVSTNTLQLTAQF